MRGATGDLVLLAVRTLASLRLRTALSIVGIAIGVGSVILRTSIGEGTRRYVLEEFAQFGTNLISINPGKTETAGLPGIFGGTTRPLTIDDAEALARIPGVTATVPIAFGSGRGEGGPDGAGRSVPGFGGPPALLEFLTAKEIEYSVFR